MIVWGFMLQTRGIWEWKGCCPVLGLSCHSSSWTLVWSSSITRANSEPPFCQPLGLPTCSRTVLCWTCRRKASVVTFATLVRAKVGKMGQNNGEKLKTLVWPIRRENWYLLTSNHPYNLWVDRSSSGWKNSCWKRLCLGTGNWLATIVKSGCLLSRLPVSLRDLELGMDAQGSNFLQEKGYRCPSQIQLRFAPSSLFLYPPPCCKIWAWPACNAVFFPQLVTTTSCHVTFLPYSATKLQLYPTIWMAVHLHQSKIQ